MKLYAHPASTVSRPVLQFLADHDGLDIAIQIVDIFQDEHLSEAYAQKNPNCLIPLLECGEFHLTESATILRFLADKIGSPLYPRDLHKRARVNELLDWFNVNFYRDWGYGFIYPQVFPTHENFRPNAHAESLAGARKRSEKWLRVLNEHLIGSERAYLCGDAPTLADYFGLSLILLGELIQCDLGAYANILRWQSNMKNLPSYAKTYTAFNGWAATMKGQEFLRIG